VFDVDLHSSRAGVSLGNFYGAGTGVIWLDNVKCAGREISLDQCRHSEVVDCTHSEDVSIACIQAYITTATPWLGTNFSDSDRIFVHVWGDHARGGQDRPTVTTRGTLLPALPELHFCFLLTVGACRT